ncbi:MAG: DUF302 domain-containing protein [Myxococcales bacterium]|nr:DUF302 domain-containing protein [Myxococcales bacterium]
MRTTTSVHDFATTVDRARSAIEARGMTVIAAIDHGANAARVGLELRPTTLLVFGNPQVGTLVMLERQTAGIDLPLKLLIWQDEAGAVRLTYDDPAGIFERHQVQGRSEVLERMQGALASIAAEAAGQ